MSFSIQGQGARALLQSQKGNHSVGVELFEHDNAKQPSGIITMCIQNVPAL